MIRALILLLLSTAPALAQEMAFLRSHALVEDQTIRVADLWDNPGARGAASLGSAPPPGRRMVIEAAQLAAIARSYGVNWRPISQNDRVVVERPGRALPRAEVEALLREEFAHSGLEPETELEIQGWIPPVLPSAALHQARLEGAVLEAPSNRFAATLVVMADGMATQRLRITGRALPTLPVVVATRRVALGEVIRPGDAREIRLRAERVRPGLASRLDQVVGQETRRPLALEGMFALVDLAPPSLVARNQPVTLLLDAPGITLTAAGRALDAAPRGAMVPVMNLASRAVVEGQVIGPGRVRVALGAVPMQRGGGD
jgi:flagella basal body P-ring formation protein FlgA